MRRRAEFWAEHLAAQRGSGHSQRAYCAQHGIKARNLRRWAQRLQRLQRTDGGPAAGPAADVEGPDSPGAGDRTSTGTEAAPEAVVLPGPVPEVLAGPELRRRWTPEQKLRLVMETLRPGASISAVARRHGVHSSVVFRWRRQLVTRAPGADGTAAPADDRGSGRSPETAPRLVPVRIADAAGPEGAALPPAAVPAPLPVAQGATGRIEIELAGGARLRVDRDVDADALRRVLAALAAAGAAP